MPKLRLSEAYLSVQGEGPRVGVPTVFVRFAGCNLRCPGWPCDTPHAIDPRIYQKDARVLDPTEVLEAVKSAAPDGGNVCFTGGEPFLQSSDALSHLSYLLWHDGYQTQEVFTNGTVPFPDWSADELYFVLDWKLPGSGEEFGEGSRQAATREANFQKLNEGDTIKFTIASRSDYLFAKAYYENWRDTYLDKIRTLNFYFGVVWGKLEASTLIGWVLEDGLLDWTYNHQIHNVIWDRNKRGI